jgi:hypothetical protein
VFSMAARYCLVGDVEVLGRDGRALALASAPEGSRSGEDGRKVVLGISPCMPQAIVDVIRTSSSVPRPVRRRGVSQLSRFVDVEVRPVDLPGKLGRLARGAQSERPTKRQSGTVKVDDSLQVEVHLATLARTGDVTKI